ncbi:exodeoxyribonuclease VII large subunit [Treponema sp.]|uniref:exodeoxyribonuclease VII large subunit n=1 Tax=Treponema sp. TaxID=166 RepID=UPI003F04FCE4
MENQNETKKDAALTVSQLTELIKTMLEGSFQNIILKGEISNFKPSASGHLYFSIKDSDCQISAVMFRGAAAALNFAPRDGMFVQARGKITVYGPRGNYQIQISSMIEAGAGNILEMIEMRKRKLAAEGLFDSGRKKTLPFFAQTVGVVTSPNGAALRDILNIRSRRNSKISIVVFPALVQGETAADSIARMIQAANRYKLCEILIVGRGGGSLEDLLPFSDEKVVRAVADSEIPVISAVGHEIDWALSDFAADVRAPTPSAAAELAFPRISDIENSISLFKENILSEMQNRINSLRLMLKTFDPENMRTRLQNIEQKYSERFDKAVTSIHDTMLDIIRERRVGLNLCIQALENCNPQNILNRGYSIVCDEGGKIIRSAEGFSGGEKIQIRPAKGIIHATVDKSVISEN